MVSNALSGRPFFPRPPVVCVSPPYDPGFQIQLLVYFLELQCYVNGSAPLIWYGSNTLRLKNEPVVSVWDLDGGWWTIPPLTHNRVESYATWNAPGYPGKYTVKCKSTWQDATVAFGEASILVVEPF